MQQAIKRRQMSIKITSNTFRFAIVVLQHVRNQSNGPQRNLAFTITTTRIIAVVLIANDSLKFVKDFQRLSLGLDAEEQAKQKNKKVANQKQ